MSGVASGSSRGQLNSLPETEGDMEHQYQRLLQRNQTIGAAGRSQFVANVKQSAEGVNHRRSQRQVDSIASSEQRGYEMHKDSLGKRDAKGAATGKN